MSSKEVGWANFVARGRENVVGGLWCRGVVVVVDGGIKWLSTCGYGQRGGERVSQFINIAGASKS